MKLWTKETFKTVTALVAVLVALGMGLAAWGRPETEEASSPTENWEYYAVLDGDKICVYDRRGEDVILFSEIDAGYMIPEDRRLLETGVPLETMEEALSLIEDFGS